MLSPVDVVLVDLVREQPEVLAARELGQRLEPGSGQHAPGRVRRRRDVERDRPRARALAHRVDRGLGGVDAVVEGHLDRMGAEGLHDAADMDSFNSGASCPMVINKLPLHKVYLAFL